MGEPLLCLHPHFLVRSLEKTCATLHMILPAAGQTSASVSRRREMHGGHGQIERGDRHLQNH